MMGSKTAARGAAIRAGVPVVPGTEQPFDVRTPDEAIARESPRTIGYPVVVKAVAGGGGKGMRVVERRRRICRRRFGPRGRRPAPRSATRSIYLERRIVRPRHIEIQLLGDQHGTVVPFVERECSIQRRHQKVVEESPSMAVDAGAARGGWPARPRRVARVGRLHQRRHDRVPARRGRRVLLPRDEHPPAGRASGHRDGHRHRPGAVADPHRPRRARSTSTRSARSTPHGHAIECRIYAEDPDQGFMPSPGLIRGLRPPSGPGVRDDGGVSAGYEVPVFYDSMIAKLVAWGDDRARRRSRACRRALREYQVLGIRTTIPFFQWLMRRSRSIAKGGTDTTYLDRLLDERRGESFTELDAAARRADDDRRGARRLLPGAASIRRRRGVGRRSAEPVAAGRPRKAALRG